MENYTVKKLAITAWAEEDRPREKLLLKGKHNLSNAELLGILLGSGSTEQSAVALAQDILRSAGNDLNELGRCSIADYMKFKGIGEAKAITIAAALELGRRRQMTDIKKRPTITCSRDSYNAIAPLLMDLPHEEFWILLLNRANRVVGRQRVSLGGTTGTVVDVKVVFKKAIEGQAVYLVLAHNHPSGNLCPSPQDLQLTKQLVAAGKIMTIGVLDHLIIGDRGYYSFKDEKLLE
ncbi:MAG: DNA repair protein RadC [Bacteroidota bacterium]